MKTKVADDRKESAVKNLKIANIIGGCLFLIFGLTQIAEEVVTTFPTAYIYAFALAALAGFLYIVAANFTYYRHYNSKPDEYQAETLKNGKSNGFNFLMIAVILLAVNFEKASQTSVPGLLFVLVAIAILISQLSTKYDPKTPAE